MSAMVRMLETPDGETVPVPDEFDHAMGRWYENSEQRSGALFRVADNLLLLLREHELAVVPLAFARSTQTVNMNLYTQALVWKGEAERRAKAAEDRAARAEAEVAALQRLFNDPPYALRAWGGVAVIRDGGVMSNETVASDPSVGEDADTSPRCAQGGVL